MRGISLRQKNRDRLRHDVTGITGVRERAGGPQSVGALDRTRTGTPLRETVRCVYSKI
jgi:hypothetical protein